MGYHKAKIKKGVLGEISKIKEEFEEFLDANDQQVKIMELCELADLLGAIEAYLNNYHINYSLDDLIKMMDLTKSAFMEGSRK